MNKEEEIKNFRATKLNMYKMQTSCKYRRWSETAVECYKSKFDCAHCPIETEYNFGRKCHMKYVVQDLLDIFGEPKEEFLWKN